MVQSMLLILIVTIQSHSSKIFEIFSLWFLAKEIFKETFIYASISHVFLKIALALNGIINDSILIFINQEKLGLSILEKMSYNNCIKESSPSFQTGIPRIQF